MIKSILNIILLLFFLFFSCGKSDTSINEQKDNPKSYSETSSLETTETVKYKCNDMFCTGCEEKITNELKKLDGVKEVNADYKTKLVSVIFNTNQTNKESVKQVINDAGYETENIAAETQ